MWWRASAFNGPVVGTAIEAPEARRAEVCEPWTELVPQQPEEPEDKVAVGSGIGHDLDRAQARLVLQKALKDVDGVAQCAWDEEAAEADELVAGEVEIGDSTPRPEVSRVGSCVDRAHGHNEAQPVGRGDVAFAPLRGEGEGGVVSDQASVGRGDRFTADVVLGDPRKPPAGQCRHARSK